MCTRTYTTNDLVLIESFSGRFDDYIDGLPDTKSHE